jgi:hypothetical protein|tara:strand:- start:1018 stop:1371 length:354 start_codon:yes stop_codon:yes gene_type:complete
VLKDHYGFTLHHLAMERQTDDKVAVAIAQGAKDTGLVMLPKKGRLSTTEQKIKQSEEFVEARRKHSAVESSINALENHGLDRCLDHGLHGFKRYVALTVLARNIQIMGHLIQQQELK